MKMWLWSKRKEEEGRREMAVDWMLKIRWIERERKKKEGKRLWIRGSVQRGEGKGSRMKISRKRECRLLT